VVPPLVDGALVPLGALPAGLVAAVEPVAVVGAAAAVVGAAAAVVGAAVAAVVGAAALPAARVAVVAAVVAVGELLLPQAARIALPAVAAIPARNPRREICRFRSVSCACAIILLLLSITHTNHGPRSLSWRYHRHLHAIVQYLFTA
jgi:hypothetical protein